MTAMEETKERAKRKEETDRKLAASEQQVMQLRHSLLEAKEELKEQARQTKDVGKSQTPPQDNAQTTVQAAAACNTSHPECAA